jgi:hypothetical protein
MAPAIVAAIIGAVPSVIQGIAGISQRNKANQLESQYPRPEASMSPYIKKLLEYSYGKTFDQDIPGGELYRNEIKGATSAGIRAASEMGSGAEAYGMLGKIVGSQNKSFTELAKMTAQRVAGAEENYMGVLSGPAYQEDRRVEYWNKEMPYLMAQQKAAQLRETGGMNIMAGVKNIAGLGMMAAAPDLYSSVSGSGKSAGGSMSEDDMNKMIEKILKGDVAKTTAEA